jgi:Ca2+:H+ antiporter
LNFLALIPLAKILGDATEELDAGLDNEVLSGLLNATFGNAVEMIFTLQSLRKGMFALVKYSLLGSILSNSLLVLGCAFFFGGIFEREANERPDDDRPPLEDCGRLGSVFEEMPVKDLKAELHWHLVKEKEQSYVASGASTMVSMSMLLVSCMSWALPTVFAQALDETAEGKATMLAVSRVTSIIMVVAYVAYLIFQLLTHRDLAQKQDEGGEDDDDDDDGEFQGLSVPASILLLFTVALLTALSSQLLVDTIDATVADSSLTTHFIGIILLPIVGNACEHAGAVRMAMVEKVDITLGIAVGSSTQIALFVVPFAVLAGWVIDQPMDLNFGQMNTTVMFFSVLIAFSICTDGSSNWLEGFMLMIAYATVATLYFFAPNEE